MAGDRSRMRRLGLFAVIATFAVGCTDTTATPVTGATSPPTTTATAADTTTTESTTTTSPPRVEIPEGRIEILPEGPFEEAQSITLLASDREFIDTYNSAPRLCATVDAAEEFCDHTWNPPQPLANPPPGATGITIDLPQWHFGPSGYRDCAETTVDCRLVWRTEAGAFLTSDRLTYRQSVRSRAVTLEVTSGDTPGTIRLSVAGLDTSAPAAEVFSSTHMIAIREAVESSDTVFDLDKLEISWEISGVCGVGNGEPPIGSEELEDPPSWWTVTSTRPRVDAAEFPSFFGGTCDWDAVQGERTLPGNGVIDLKLQRNIYGFAGWVDCAIDPCYLSVIVRWLYPMRDGSQLGSDEIVERVFLDITEDWPSIRPSISIAEPGPYETGDHVTVEVRDHDSTNRGLAIGWCSGGDNYCSYKFSTYEEGIHRVTWRLTASAETCGTNRCYFEIDSAGEGLAPPAIVIVPFE